MALGQLGSLGIASNVLTSDLVNKMKELDESNQIKPYDTKIETNTAKKTALTELTTKLSAFKTAISSLGDSTAFSNRKVDASVTGDNAAASLDAASGVNIQDLLVTVEQIAKHDVYQSKGFNKDTDMIAPNLPSGTKATFTLVQNDKEYSIEVDSNTTFRELADKINNATGGNIQAKIINTGEKTNPYRLTLTSKETGTDNAIGFYAGTKSNGIYQEDSNAVQVLSSLGWNLKTTDFAADGFKGFSSSSINKINLGSSTTGLQTSLGIAQDTKFTVFVGEEAFEIEAKTTDTYQDLIDRVDQVTGSKVQLSAAGNVKGEFNFSFSAGVNAPNGATVTVFDGAQDGGVGSGGNFQTDANASSLLSNTLGINVVKKYGVDDPNGEYHIKQAQNAIFTVDGVKMTRQSNEVKDIGTGLTLTLKTAGEINFSIKQDTESLSTAMEELVEKYNDLVNYLSEVTKYDTETGTSGDLQGVSEVNNIRTNLVSILFQTQTVAGTIKDENGNDIPANVAVSLQDFGLNMTEDGLLTFTSSEFTSKMSEDISFAEKFFAGVSGFENLNYVGEQIKLDQDIDFKDSGFKITFNETTYDLSKTVDGKDFVLTGADAAERARKLLEHINSFGIEDLNVSLEEVSVTDPATGQKRTEYALKFDSDNGSDFKVEGKDDFLKDKLGLSATQLSPQLEQGTGVFAKLNDYLKGLTGTDGTLTLYEQRLTTENKALQDSKEKTQTSIDTKYETLEETWIQYELIISKINTQAQAVNAMIASMSSSNSNS